MSGLDQQIEFGSSSFFAGLERLTKTAPNHDVWPVTVDPRLNRVLVSRFENHTDEDDFVTSLRDLGFTPPSHATHAGVHISWLPDEEPNDIDGILTWNTPSPTEEP